MTMPIPPEVTLAGNTMPIPECGCIIWMRSVDGGGYGQFRHRGKMLKAHRVSYELAKGPIPSGLELDHKCRVRSCVNPEHLEPVTHQVNVHRGIGPTAVNAAKTHCIRGHELTEENRPVGYSDGGRRCLICFRASCREAARRYRTKRKGV